MEVLNDVRNPTEVGVPEGQTILQLRESSGFYGAENVVIELSRALSARGQRVMVGILAHDRSKTRVFERTAKDHGLSVLVFPVQNVIDMGALFGIRQLIRRRQVDIVQSHGYTSNFYALAGSIGFAGNVGQFDETADARRVAALFGTEHHELTMRPDIRELAPWLAEFFDEPFGNSSAIPNYYVSQMARGHVTVALNGLGGDEVAVGYPRHLGLLAAQYYRKMPRFVREQVLPGLVGVLPDSRGGSVFSERLKRFVSGSNAPLYRSYLNYMTYLSLREKKHSIPRICSKISTVMWIAS